MSVPNPVAAAPTRAERRAAARVSLLSLGAYVAFVVVIAVTQHGHPEWFAKFGDEGQPTVYARIVLGDDIEVPFDEVHDGATFWMLSRDPLIREPAILNRYAVYPAYRAQRILYPALVAPWRLLGEQSMLWGMVITNLGVVLVGTYVTARLAQHLRAPAAVGYAFAFSPAVLVSLALDVADGLAAACVIGVVLLVRRNRWGCSAVVGVLAVLAREQSWLALVIIAAFAPGTRRSRLSVVVWPGLAGVLWFLYVQSRLGWGTDAPENFVVVPFKGFVDSYRFGWSPTGRMDEMVIAVLGLLLGVYVVVRFFRRRTLELAACLPFAVLEPFYASVVLYRTLNSARVLGPLVALLAVDVFAEHRAKLCNSIAAAH